MGTAISIGTTGLTAASKQMDVIGNNLANANTLGYKSASTYFASMLNQSLSSGGDMQSGSGVAVASVATQYAQGSFENTGNATDLAIDGEGFFMVKDTEGAQYYTRAGAFHVSENGLLVDNSNFEVQGYNNSVVMDINGEDKLTSISLKNVQSTPKATTQTSMGINLDETAVAGDKFNVSQTVYDSKGQQHNLSTTFQKTEQYGTWGYTVKLDDSNISTGHSADGVTFDLNGAISGMYHGAMDAATVSTAVGTGTVAAAGVATIVTGAEITADGTMVLTKSNDGTDAWKITTTGGYADATITEDNISVPGTNTISIDLDGDGTNTFTFDITDAAGAWNTSDTLSIAMTTVGPAATATATHRAVGTGTAVGTLVKGGQIYQTTATPIVLTAVGSDSGIWSITGNGGYENMVISAQETGYLKVDLDGEGGVDLYFNISASTTWKNGDTVQFDLTRAEVTVEDQILQFGALDNGATIGVFDTSSNKNKITWAVATDTTNIISGYASGSVVRSLSNNGYTSGVLKAMTIGGDGTISGFFTNGQTSKLGQIILANFPNPGGLKKVGNYFGATIDSGEAIKNNPGSGGLGEVMSNTLEISNTDTAKEFINMITAQRAYSSNAKVITTADQMMQELMSIKR